MAAKSTAEYTATGTHVGRCVVCGTLYFAASDADRGHCTCRATTPCAKGFCGEPGHVHPVTAIKWNSVQASKSTRECNEVCVSAKSAKCMCECAGENHGRALGLTH